MPSGVEHSASEFASAARGFVRNPLMPSGVEHKVGAPMLLFAMV